LQAQGDLDGARSHYEQALAIAEAAYGPHHSGVAASLYRLAGVLRAQGDLDGARRRYEQALAIRETRLGPDHPEVAVDLYRLAGVVRAQGDLDGARSRYERALAIDEVAYGLDHLEVATDLSALAGVLEAQRDLDGARSHYERALAIAEAAHGLDHPGVAASLYGLAGVLRAQGDLDGARSRYERALAIAEAALSPDDLQLATLHDSLAGVLQAQGDLDGARRHYEQALAIRETRLGPRVQVLWRVGDAGQKYALIYDREQWVGEISNVSEHGCSKLMLRPLRGQDPPRNNVIVIGYEDDPTDSLTRGSALLTGIGPGDPTVQLLYDDVSDSGIQIWIPGSALEQLPSSGADQPVRILIEPCRGTTLNPAEIVVARENDLYVSFPHWSEAIEKISYEIDGAWLNINVRPGDEGLKLRRPDVFFTRGVEYAGLPEPNIARLQRRKGRGPLQLVISLPYQEGAIGKLSYKLEDKYFHIVARASQSFWPLNPDDVLFKTTPLPELATQEQSELDNEENDLCVSFPHWPEAVERISYTIDGNWLNIIVKPGEEGLKLRKPDVRFTRGVEYAGLPKPNIARLKHRKGRGSLQLVVSLPYQENSVETAFYKLQDDFIHIVIRVNRSFWPLNQDEIVFKTTPVR
jgi:tetratricopeptide (TPR) repeat protein